MVEQDAPSRRRGLLADAGLLVFVAALGVKAGFGVAAVRDADISDECYYLMSAVGVPERGLPAVEDAPLYVLWDYLLLKIGTPLEEVPVRSWAALAVLLPVATFLLVRALGGGRLAALVAGGVIPATTLIDIYPYPMHLATVILVLGTALAARLNRPAAGAVIGLTLLTVTFARPEFLYALLLYLPPVAVLALWALCRRPAMRRAVVASAVVFACGAALLVWAFGNPKGDGRRSFIAFGQHYAANRHDAGARTENQWHYWELYVRSDFGDVSTVGGAWRSNREAFLWHLGANVRRTPSVLRAVAAPRVDLWKLRSPQFTPPDAPTRHPTVESLVRWLMLAGLASGLLGTAVGLRRLAQGRDEARRLPVALAMLAIVAAPAVAAVLLVYPRFHYLIPTVVFTTALAAAGFRHLPRPERLRGKAATRLALVATVVALALVVPNRANGWCVQAKLGKARNGPKIESTNTVIRSSVRTIRGLGLRPPVRVLEVGSARAFYSGFGAGHVFPQTIPAGEGFLAFVQRADIGLIVLEPVMAECPQLRDDPDFRALMDGKESARFRLVPVDGYPFLRVAARRDLLPAE